MALISRWNIVRLRFIAMQIGLSRVPWDEDSSVKDRRDAMLIQFVDMEPLSRNSIRATQKQDPVRSLVVKWLKPGIRLPRGDVKGGGRKLLSYWSHWRRTVWCLDVGNEVTGQVMYHQICLPERVSYTSFVRLARRSFSWRSHTKGYFRSLVVAADLRSFY